MAASQDKLNRLFDLETDFTFESSEQAWAALLWVLEIENAQPFWRLGRPHASLPSKFRICWLFWPCVKRETWASAIVIALTWIASTGWKSSSGPRGNQSIHKPSQKPIRVWPFMKRKKSKSTVVFWLRNMAINQAQTWGDFNRDWICHCRWRIGKWPSSHPCLSKERKMSDFIVEKLSKSVGDKTVLRIFPLLSMI